MSEYDVCGSQKKLLLGLQIFDKHRKEDELWYVEAGHDEILASGPDPKDLDTYDATVLLAAGWTWDDSNLCWHLFV